MILKALFCRLVREIIEDLVGPGRGFRIQSLAINTLQEAIESAIIIKLEYKFLVLFILIFILIYIIVSNLAAIHAKRVTLQQKDMQLVRRMRQGLVGHGWAGNISAPGI